MLDSVVNTISSDKFWMINIISLSRLMLFLFLGAFISACSDTANINSQPMPEPSQLSGEGGSIEASSTPIIEPLTPEGVTDPTASIDLVNHVLKPESIEGDCAHKPAGESNADNMLTTSLNPASDIATEHMGMKMRYRIYYSEDGSANLQLGLNLFDVTTYVPLHIRYPFHSPTAFQHEDSVSNALELINGERLVVFVNGVASVMQDMPILGGGGEELEGYGHYVTNISNVMPGQCVRVSLERAAGKVSALDTVFRIPPLFTMLSPKSRDAYSETDNILINWGVILDDGNLRNEMELIDMRVNTICTSPDTGEIQGLSSRYHYIGITPPLEPPAIFSMHDLLPHETDTSDYFSGRPTNWDHCFMELVIEPNYEASYDVDHDHALANVLHPEMMGYISDTASAQQLILEVDLY